MATRSVPADAVVHSDLFTGNSRDGSVERPPARRSLSRLWRNEQGSVTVEYVLWLPFFLLLFVAITDVSVTFYSHSRMWDVARDATRRVATGQMTADEAKAYAESLLPNMGNYSVTVDDTGSNDVVVTITGQDILINVLQLEGLVAEFKMRKEAAA